ncbi:hypothetical protein V1478_008025 [Vespula squamosa]|uniref:Uncharacterized protein n=1 Tax=Vespula squamosa TaxID=30214 RepID=A0ABD2AXL2_VESSQ
MLDDNNLMPSMNPCQSRVPLQTNQNNFQTYQQTNNQQSTQCPGYPGNSQGQYMQGGPFGQFYQQENYSSAQYPYTTQVPNNSNNLYQGIPCQNTMPPMQTQANTCGSLPQNIIDQIRSCITNTAPIFIIPGGCQQPLVTTQQATPISNMLNSLTNLDKQSNYSSPLPSIYPPSFYPYPIPFPVFDPYGARSNEQQKNCGCSSKSNGELTGLKQFPALSYPHNSYHEGEHCCTNTTDDTICSKRNCPSAISLQALASQLLAIQGIISCTATRLLLRKIPGSNITTTMEDTMEKAQRSISALNKDQLLSESRNSQQVNALINLHMTANPPANIIPILTLVQLKVNVLKAQVENQINTKLMENQGLEVEATDSIDPTILALKTDAELREFLVILKQKECDERVNLNYSPYRSQRVIAESRLSNIQKKIQQIEVEFERRRCNVAPSIPISSRIVREFAETPGNFSRHPGYPGLTSPTTTKRRTIESKVSPDPFAITLKSPRKLRLKPHVGSPETTYDYSNKKEDQDKTIYNDKGSQIEPETKEKKRTDRSSFKSCTCYDETSSEESSEEEKKKKLQLQIDERGNVTVTSESELKNVSFMKLASNVSLRTVKPNDVFEKRDRKVKPSRREIDSKDFREPSLPTVPKVEEISEDRETDESSVSADVDLVSDAKPYDTVGEKERESIERPDLTLEEFKDDADAYKDEKEKTKVSVSDVNIIDEEKIKKIADTSDSKEFTPSNDKEVQIPDSKLDKTSVSIEEGVIEVDKIKTNAYIEESREKISTDDIEQKLYTVKEEEIEDITKPETTETKRTEEMEVESPKETFVTTASVKIEPTKIEEEYIDEPTPRTSKIDDDLTEKPKKTFLTTFKFDNSVKPKVKDETERTMEVKSPKKTFISTASIKVEPPKIEEEYIDEPRAGNSKISDELSEKPKKTFLTTFKFDNSVKPKVKDETERTMEVKSPKKTFISTASIKVEPPKIEEEYIDEPRAGNSKISDELSEKPKKTFLTTFTFGNSVKPKVKDETERTMEVKSPKKTFISTASIKVEPPKIEEEYIDEPRAGNSKISDELSEKPKKTFLTTFTFGNSVKPEVKDVTEKTMEVKSPKKTFISTASIRVEPPKIEEEYIDEPRSESSKISNELSEKSKKTFLTTLKIGNSIKPEVKDENERMIESRDSKKTYVSKAFIKVEPEGHEERQLETKIFKSNPMELRINLNNRKGNENRDRENAKVRSEKSPGGLYKSTVNFVLKGADERDQKSVGTNTIATISIGKKEDEVKEKKKSDVGTNEKIVSVLTEIKYDEPEAIAELFRSALTRNFQLDNDITDRSCESKYESLETGNYYTMALSFPENCYPWKIDIKKQENGTKHLNKQNRDASENAFHPEETWTKLNSCKYNTDNKTRFPFVNSDHDTSNTIVENNKNILSEIISLMSNQISYFGNAINKMSLFGNTLSSFDGSVSNKVNSTTNNYSKNRSKDFDKIWTKPCKEYLAIFEDVRKLDNNEIENLDRFVPFDSKRSIKKLDKKVRRVIKNGSSRVSRKDDNNEIRDRLRYMIIKDEDNKKSYVVPEDSFGKHNSQLYPRPNLGRPYKIRRNLLIRSRLKDCNAFKQNLLPPFTIVKRTHVRNWKSFCETPREEKRRGTFSRVKNVEKDENFFSVPLIKEKNSKISSTLEKSSTSKPIPNESDTKTSVTFFSTDSYVSTEENVTLKDHDY